MGRQGGFDLGNHSGECDGQNTLHVPGAPASQWNPHSEGPLRSWRVTSVIPEPCTVPALSFPFLSSDMEPDHSKDSVSVLQLCILCLSVFCNTMEGLRDFSWLGCKNILRILAIFILSLG